MPRIFISYRRADSISITGRVYDRLVMAFGRDNVFKDVNDIPMGADFRRILQKEVDEADLLLVMIGKTWANITDEQGNPRLMNPNDFVRIEVESGLNNSAKLVIPVLLSGAGMPAPDQLPETLRELAFRNAAIVREDPDFHRDVQRLINHIKQEFPEAATTQTKTKPTPPPPNSLWGIGGILLVLILLGLGTFAAVQGGLFAFPTATKIVEVATTVPDTNTPKPPTLTKTPTDTPPASTMTLTPSFTSTVSPTPIETPNCAVADGFDSPVGTEEQRAGATVWPTGWTDASPFGTHYFVGTPSEAYHTGADLNFGKPYEDLGMPVYATASGEIVFADKVDTWGYIIIIRHDPYLKCDGQVIYSRYGQLNSADVQAGQRVERGQQITVVGDAFGRFIPHLHFDISITDILNTKPSHWPGADQTALLTNYIDPLTFLQSHRPGLGGD